MQMSGNLGQVQISGVLYILERLFFKKKEYLQIYANKIIF